MNLSPHTINNFSYHNNIELLHDEHEIDVHHHKYDLRLPKKYYFPKRFIHTVSSSIVHIPTGIAFIENKVISQSGQVYSDAQYQALQYGLNKEIKLKR